MKSLTLRAGLALLCAVILASCGGSNGSLVLSGTITGLTKSGLVLTNGSKTLPVDAGATQFVFPDLLSEDEAFDVEVKPGTPVGAVCTPSNNKAKANAYTVYQTVITCVTNSYSLGGAVTGLKSGDTVVLTNGSDTASVKGNADGSAVSFVFPLKVADGALYGVTVYSAPTGKTCSIGNGIGIMPGNNVSNIQITCQ
ncbi:hypothetical protein ACLB1G_23870 [Oxalobacteraceae bacterium A2-2]